MTTARTAQERERRIYERRRQQEAKTEAWLGLNLGLTKEGLTQLLGPGRPRLDAAFERGACNPETIAALNDPPPSKWVRDFLSDRIDGVLTVAGPDPSFVIYHGNALRERFGTAIKIVYSEMGRVRPGQHTGYEHFGFRDGISQPGIRGLTPVSEPRRRPDQKLPNQNLI